MMDVIQSLQLEVKEGNTSKEVPHGGGDMAEELHDGGGMEMDEAGCSFIVAEGDSDEDHDDNPADTGADACGELVVGIKVEGQQPGQKRKCDTDIGTDGCPNKRITTSADDVEKNSKSDEAAADM